MAESVELKNSIRLGDTYRGFMIGFAIGAVAGIVGAILYTSQFYVG